MSESERATGRVLSSRTAWDGGWLQVEVEQVALPDGREAEMFRVRHPGAAAIVPVDDDGQVLLLRQYRHAIGRWVLEIPAGKIDDGEEVAAGAARELEEETGYRPRELIGLGSIWTSPGFTDERIWLFLARGLESGRQDLEADELLEIERMPMEWALEMAVNGELEDGKSVSALLRARRHLE